MLFISRFQSHPSDHMSHFESKGPSFVHILADVLTHSSLPIGSYLPLPSAYRDRSTLQALSL